MQRRPGRKSRHGCRECKARHVKCDEGKPSCANCRVRRLSCSFLPNIPVLPRTTASTPSCPLETGASPLATAISPPASRCELATAVPLAGPTISLDFLLSTEQTFKFHHLELLHNFRSDVLGRVLAPATIDRYMSMAVEEASKAPYIMDQLLAISAANMSTKRPHKQHFYQQEATQLQTRGLASFNASKEVAENALAGFVFSTLLSQQVLFDAFSTRSDFPLFLDSLVNAFRICSGVKFIAGSAWPLIREIYGKQTGIAMPTDYMVSGAQTILTQKLAELEMLLARENLGPSTLNPCSSALCILREISHSPPSDRSKISSFRTTRVLHWAVRVPPEFVQLLEQRRPEALIITAYFALLVHDTRDYWAYGDTGAFLIRSITRFLGTYWAQWLAWPNQVLDSAGCVDEVRLTEPIDMDISYHMANG
ncbi:hypothetical protein F4808DRAFT_61604 [Astrocystis sublimbata]|nr:hypothetical protein F4808DRAFT_61604 [Astrocystis sublimbata]